ncbi:MAG: 1,4-alpha-glucan-branching enzyme [Lentisphaerae bacterium]|nr:1,4-alpha-glucan-branching enzyme [Lentisphaerota bacterium]
MIAEKSSCNQLQIAPLRSDAYLQAFFGDLDRRAAKTAAMRKLLTGKVNGSLAEKAAREHEFFGLHRRKNGSWIFREWAPAARRIFLVGDFSNFEEKSCFELERCDKPHGCWAIELAKDVLHHNMHYYLHIYFADGTMGVRLPAYANYVVQDSVTNIFTAQIYAPEQPYQFKHASPAPPSAELIYEAHVGMAQSEGKVGSFNEFTENVLPRIARNGYTTIQLMAIMSHPYYGSFGYHVANFFSISSRFGTPDDLKRLIDEAHALGLRVIMDVVHSHAVKNEVEGLARFDGSREQYFHSGSRGEHSAWDSLCFDYGKTEVVKFLLSNLRFYLEEYHLDGFRFDGVTSMLYMHHGLNMNFTGYNDYFNLSVDEDAYTYLALANTLIHEVRPDALTVAEEVSGMPGIAADTAEGGAGFNMRMAMNVTDIWFKLFDLPDEKWDMVNLYYELLNRRQDERCISYVECHDQAIVGGQTAIFRLAGSDIYHKMRRLDSSYAVNRAVDLHKLSRLITAATSCSGYLNFMGNEFGHPEWIDFPREGNNWSYHYARRQWALADDPELFYSALGEFDRAMLQLLKEFDIWQYTVRKLKLDNADKIIAFERGNLWLFFNFHSQNSYTGYGIEVMPGKYRLLINSDEERFAGHNRLNPVQEYFTIPETDGNILKHELKLYLPCRSALVLTKVD